MRFTSGSHAKFVAHHQRHASIACRADNRSIRAILEVANSRHARHRPGGHLMRLSMSIARIPRLMCFSTLPFPRTLATP
ncbi:MAG: hypothetical protein WBB61_14760 [Dokdonella sp.]